MKTTQHCVDGGVLFNVMRWWNEMQEVLLEKQKNAFQGSADADQTLASLTYGTEHLLQSNPPRVCKQGTAHWVSFRFRFRFKLWIQLGNLFWSLPEDRLTSFQVQRSKLYCLVAQWWSGEHLKHALMSLCWQETDILWLKIIKSSFSFNMGFKVIRINNVLLVDKVLNSVLVVWYLVSPTVLQY